MVFWTTAIPDSDVTVNLGAGRAEMKVNNLALGDYFTKANAFGANWQTGDIDATVSFDVVWSGPVTRRLNFQDSTHIDPFAGEFAENQVSVTWSGSNANGFTFTANPGDFSTSFNAFAELAHVQNGTFFTAESATPAAALVEAPLALTPPRGTPAAPVVSAALPAGNPPRPGVAEAPPLKDSLPNDSLVRMIRLTGAGHAKALDPLFADPDGSPLSGAL
jgi:hypothetical protein